MRCNLCPRSCNALRGPDHGAGRCAMPEGAVLARAALHYGEEPSISGTGGSGTIFFSGCSLGCVFCQNEAISHGNFGASVCLARLGEICRALVEQGAHNINFVNPTHYAHVVAAVLKKQRLSVPVVFNSGGYDKVETLRTLEGLVDVYLPDLKHLTPAAAQRYCAAPDYPQWATAAICEMVRQTGPWQLDGLGLLKKGVIIRHLLLPGQLNEAKAVMDWVAGEFPSGTVGFSLMSQYTPWGELSSYPEINRKLRRGEQSAAMDYMANLGLDGYTQELTSAKEEYTPAFDLTGL